MRGSDSAWVEKMAQQFPKGHAYYEPKRLSRTEFVVKHYAGPVDYESTGFLEKNKDSMSQDLTDVMGSTEHEDMSLIFKQQSADAAPQGAGGKKVATIASKFMSQLNTLVSVLSSRQLHYIRCIKPTETKQPGVFDGSMVARQLSYSGVLETIEVRKIGYAVRMPFAEFVGRYALLLEQAASSSSDGSKLEGSAGAKYVLENVGCIPADVYKLGTSKVFLKNERVLYELDRRREEGLLKYVVRIQSYWRRHKAMMVLKLLREEERRRKEEERRRKEEEERKRREEEERRRKEEEERAKMAEEERKRLEEAEAAARAEAAEKKRLEEQQASADSAAKEAAAKEAAAAESAASNFQIVESAAKAVRRLSISG